MKCRLISGFFALAVLGVATHAQSIPDDVGKSSAGLPTALQNVGFEPQVLAVPAGGLVEGFDLLRCQGSVGKQVELHVVVSDGAPHGGEELGVD